MIRKLIASCCLALLALSSVACTGPSDVITVDPSARTLPGDGEGGMKNGEGVSIDPEK